MQASFSQGCFCKEQILFSYQLYRKIRVVCRFAKEGYWIKACEKCKRVGCEPILHYYESLEQKGDNRKVNRVWSCVGGDDSFEETCYDIVYIEDRF